MHCHMLGFVAFYGVLRVLFTCVMCVSFVFKSAVCISIILPDTNPASEFHFTWSPILNECFIFYIL